jgi:hypothetical protein
MDICDARFGIVCHTLVPVPQTTSPIFRITDANSPVLQLQLHPFEILIDTVIYQLSATTLAIRFNIKNVVRIE